MALYRGPGGSGDATNDATSQSIIATQAAIEAAESAIQAAASAVSASNNATAASNSASAASTSATNASNFADDAADYATAAASALDEFTDLYLGAKTTNPSVDNDGNALQTGALYFNTVANEFRVYTGFEWQVITVGAVGDSVITQRFSGDGSTIAFTLSTEPFSENSTFVYINGAYQQKNTYNVSGLTLTFSEAPPTGADNIEVLTITMVDIDNITASIINITDSGGYYVSSKVEGALQEAATFTQSGTGAVLRTKTDKLKETVSVKDFGAVGDGVTDDTAAIQAAINAASAGWSIFFPRGSYNVSSTITLKSGVTLFGESQYGPSIKTSTASLIIFSGTSLVNVKIAGLSFSCLAANVTAVKVSSSNRFNVSDVIFYGCETNIDYDLGGFLSIENCVSANQGLLKSGKLKLWSSDDTKYGCVFSSIVNYRIENNGAGVQSPAIYFRRAVGIKVTNLMTTNNVAHGNGTCIVFENDCQGITVSNSLIVDYALGVVFQKGAGIDKEPVANVLSNVDFDQCRTNSILMTAGSGNQIFGGVITSSFIATDKQAIVLTGVASNNTIEGVHITGYYDSPGAGVYLNNCGKYNRIYNLSVSGSYQGITFNGAITQTQIANCDLSNNINFPISGNYFGEGNILIDIKGFKPVFASPAFPASGVDYRNDFGVPCRVFVFGGTSSNIEINGNVAGVVAGTFLLMPNETIAVNYSVAPAWNWVPI